MKACSRTRRTNGIRKTASLVTATAIGMLPILEVVGAVQGREPIDRSATAAREPPGGRPMKPCLRCEGRYFGIGAGRP